MSDFDLSALLPYEPGYASCWLGDLDHADGDPQQFAWVRHGEEVTDATNRLAAWIAGAGPSRRPRGSVLVTGLRGVGKTTLVNLALHRAARQLRNRSQAGDRVAEALLVVWVDCPRSINAPDLLRRVLRRFYLAVVDQGLAEIEPSLVQQARMAYLRTLGSFKESMTEGWKRTIGFELESIGRLEVDENGCTRTGDPWAILATSWLSEVRSGRLRVRRISTSSSRCDALASAFEWRCTRLAGKPFAVRSTSNAVFLALRACLRPPYISINPRC